MQVFRTTPVVAQTFCVQSRKAFPLCSALRSTTCRTRILGVCCERTLEWLVGTHRKSWILMQFVFSFRPQMRWLAVYQKPQPVRWRQLWLLAKRLFGTGQKHLFWVASKFFYAINSSSKTIWWDTMALCDVYGWMHCSWFQKLNWERLGVYRVLDEVLPWLRNQLRHCRELQQSTSHQMVTERQRFLGNIALNLSLYQETTEGTLSLDVTCVSWWRQVCSYVFGFSWWIFWCVCGVIPESIRIQTILGWFFLKCHLGGLLASCL